MKRMFLLTAVVGFMFMFCGTVSAEVKSADPAGVQKQKAPVAQKVLSEKEYKAIKQQNILYSKKKKDFPTNPPRPPSCPDGTDPVGPPESSYCIKSCSLNGKTGTQNCRCATQQCIRSDGKMFYVEALPNCGECKVGGTGGTAIDQPADGGSGTGGIGR